MAVTSGSIKKEAPEFSAFVRRVLASMGRRAAGGDLESLAHLAKLRDALDDAIEAGGRGAHDLGFSYTEIAAALGVSRQAARQRFVQTGEDVAPDPAVEAQSKP